MSKLKFIRRDSNRYSKLGKKRKKKQVWRRPTGRDNKMREKRKGYPMVVEIGRKKKSEKKKVVFVRNVDDLQKVGKGNEVSIGKVGKKKKMEIVKKAKEMKISFVNLNINKILKKLKIKPEKKENESK